MPAFSWLEWLIASKSHGHERYSWHVPSPGIYTFSIRRRAAFVLDSNPIGKFSVVKRFGAQPKTGIPDYPSCSVNGSLEGTLLPKHFASIKTNKRHPATFLKLYNPCQRSLKGSVPPLPASLTSAYSTARACQSLPSIGERRFKFACEACMRPL